MATSHITNTSTKSGAIDEYEFVLSDEEEEDDEDSRLFTPRDSDEDTEDASETDAAKLEEEFTEMKEQIYKDKLALLKKHLAQINDCTHPEMNKKLKKLEQLYKERLRFADNIKNYEIEAVERQYIREKKISSKDFDIRKVDLKENLLLDLEDKRRIVDFDRQIMELGGDSMEVKTMITRKLRRRPNDPTPLPEKRRKQTPSQIDFLLSDEEIVDDIKMINKSYGKIISSKKPMSTSSSDGLSAPKHDVRIEENKLLYDKRCFHRNQSVYIESKDMGKVAAVITSIGTNEIWVRKTSDNQKMRVYVSHMQKGKYKIRKRST
ncbi:sin3 histone deacetylase corepressor complex component SDS3-like [Antedon mediterranea]|uniref:sin3 histone deacetylase corepressor complex component SDS3-like n=1 Tax=Antedon mediterranea TaxID=105859 RepID=UPI003AF89185